ncbi:MAG: hypothetical protein ACF8LK_08200 [Phycisphaerales bacterium JB041]
MPKHRVVMCLLSGLVAAGGATTAEAQSLPESWSLRQVARAGQGGLPYQMRFMKFETPAVNDRGDWAIATDRGLLVNGVLLSGQQYNRPDSSVGLSGSGVVAWAGSVSTGDGGIFTYDIDSGEGGWATNGPDERFSKRNPTINSNGLIAYGGASQGFDSVNLHDLTTGESRVGVQGNGSTVRIGERVVVNEAGQVAYYDAGGSQRGMKRLEPDGSTTFLYVPGIWSNREWFWMNDHGDIAALPERDQIWRTTDDGPELMVGSFSGPGSQLFRSLEVEPPSINNHGWVSFRADLEDSSDSVFLTDGDDFAAVALEGDLVRTDLGWGRIDSIDAIPTNLNNRGELLVLADVRLLGGGHVNDVLFFATVPSPGWAGLALATLLRTGRRRR